MRTVGCGLDAGAFPDAGLVPCKIDAAVPGRETVIAACLVEGTATALRCFARSRGDSICAATVSSIFADPTIMDLGRGFRAAVLRGLLGTACVLVVSFALTGSTIDTGLGVLFRLFRGRIGVVAGLGSIKVTAGDVGVADLGLYAWKTSGPRDRLSDSCTLNISSCIDERS